MIKMFVMDFSCKICDEYNITNLTIHDDGKIDGKFPDGWTYQEREERHYYLGVERIKETLKLLCPECSREADGVYEELHKND